MFHMGRSIQKIGRFLYKTLSKKDFNLDENENLEPNRFKVLYKDILFVSTEFVQKRNIVSFHTKDDVFYEETSIKYITESASFVRISKWEAINVNHITSMFKLDFVFIGTMKFKVSRQYKRSLKQFLLSHNLEV